MRWLALLAVACSSSPADPPERSGGQFEVRAATGAVPPRLTVLVVDDAPTPAAAALRERVADDLERGMHQVVTNRWGSCYSNDPAEDHYTDERIVVVFPSAPGVATMSPATSPGLAWITDTTSHREARSIAEATEQALNARTAAPGEVYRPIRAATRTAQLVLGLRARERGRERAPGLARAHRVGSRAGGEHAR